MNPTIPPEKILEKYDALPDDLKTALFSSAVTNNILGIGRKYGLHVDKAGELADETGLVMLGITPPGEFIRNLAKRLELDPEKAKAIAEEINQQIFQPVRESLKKVHGLGAQPAEKPSAIQAGAALKAKPRKTLPIRSDITEKNIPKRDVISFPPPLLAKERGLGGEVSAQIPKPAEIETKVKAIFDEIERKKSRKYAPEITPIFAKNIPAESQSIQAGGPLKDDLEADLEKKLSEAKPQQNNYQKNIDP